MVTVGRGTVFYVILKDIVKFLKFKNYRMTKHNAPMFFVFFLFFP